MAVYAAHLTRTLTDVPTVFQVAAQDALGATVKPALRKFVEYLASVYPDKFNWTERWFDEVYLLFDYFLQYHYLKHYAASFSESFYGLLRVPVAQSGEFCVGQRLPKGVERGSLMLLTLLPFLMQKLERTVEGWRERRDDGLLGKSKADRLRAASVRVYSVCHCIWSLARLAQLAQFVRGKASAPTPSLAALGLALRSAPPREPAADEYTWGDLFRSLLSGDIGGAVVTFPMVGSLALSCVEYGAFGVQFLRWWAERRAGGAQGPLPTPQPPQRDERAVRWSNKCPLCLRSWRVPTALPVSGYVFCYVCISRHVRAHSKCPVSGLPATEGGLVRLYTD